MSTRKCCVCSDKVGELESEEREHGNIPLCRKKECVRTFVWFFGKFCESIDKQAGMDTEGFVFNQQLVRYSHFDEDFEKVWKTVRVKEAQSHE